MNRAKCGWRSGREETEPELLSRFYSKTKPNEETGCVEWTGNIKRGYGGFRWGEKSRLAHRIAWALEYGDPPDGMCVCHKCDNRRCVNIFHLFLGTSQDNSDDKMAKGRNRVNPAKGESAGKSKLTNEQVLYIRSNPDNLNGVELAKKLGVWHNTIYAIRRGEAWRHLL